MAGAFQSDAFQLDAFQLELQPQFFDAAFASLVSEVDRAVRSNLGGETVLYQPAVGPSVQVTGIFDAPYVLARGAAESGVQALIPSVFLRLEDLPTDPEDDTPALTIRGVVYNVKERRPDGIGGIVLGLRKAS